MLTLHVFLMCIHTSGWLVASYSSNPYVSQISHIQCPIRRHHQRGRTIKPGIFSIAIAGLIAVTVGIVLQDTRWGEGNEEVANKQRKEVRTK